MSGEKSPLPSPTGSSRKSRDSGFSDSEMHLAVAALVIPSSESDQCPSPQPREPVAGCSRDFGGDVSQIHPPPHSSTPKSKDCPRLALNASPIPTERKCPVETWMRETRHKCDPECQTALQNKAISAAINQRIANIVSSIVCGIRSIHTELLNIISKENMVYKKVIKGSFRGCNDLFARIVQNMENILSEHGVRSDICNCTGLQMAFEELCHDRTEIPNLKKILKSAAIQFSRAVECVISRYIQDIVNLLQKEKSAGTLLVILNGFWSMGLQAEFLSELLTKCGGITSLLSLIVNCRSQAVHTSAMNILATVCCTPESIEQFDNSGGIEVLTPILCNVRHKLKSAEYCAALSLFVQVTASWNDQPVTDLHRFLDLLVPALTCACRKAPSNEIILLSTAALANISGLDARSCKQLASSVSVGMVLGALRVQGVKTSVHTKEQAATLIANMSNVAKVIPHLTLNRVVPALLNFLHVSPSPLQNKTEKRACFRLRYKAVIALSRLVADPEAAKQVVELQGISRLVKICKDESERNYNDNLLLAALMTLRKITLHCGIEAIDAYNACDLVEPNLWDSFIRYASNPSAVLPILEGLQF